MPDDHDVPAAATAPPDDEDPQLQESDVTVRRVLMRALAKRQAERDRQSQREA